MELHVPATLKDAITYYADPENCRKYLAAKRWPDGVVRCPACGNSSVSFMPKHQRWQCSSHHSRRQFSIKVDTIFEDSPIGLDKWLPAMWLITNAKNGISSWEIHRALGVTQKTAWFMLHRIRLAHAPKIGGNKMCGQIEADETYIGGKARNMHKVVRTRKITGTGGKDKTAVMGILERGKKGESRVHVKVVPNTRKKALQSELRDHVLAGSAIFTDSLPSYEGLDEFQHEVVDHAVEYVKSEVVHTNGLENFWSLLKRSLKGTYVSVEPFHLFRYLDEQAFRYNNRHGMTDAERFDLAVSGIVGKRIMYKQLTGKTPEEQTETPVAMF